MSSEEDRKDSPEALAAFPDRVIESHGFTKVISYAKEREGFDAGRASVMEWGLCFEGREDSTESWGNDEQGARHRASKFDNMLVMQRSYLGGDWAIAP